jgi:hypothetical protein
MEENMRHAHHTPDRKAKAGVRAQGDLAGMPSDPAPRDGDVEMQIREAAYYLYLARGAKDGDALQDWLQAESELLMSETPQDPRH